MALLDRYGLIVALTALEINPLCNYSQEDDPVYKDSALEVFLNMEPNHMEKGYLNFEMNAKGVLLSEFGLNRKRTKIKQLTSYHAKCKAEVNNVSWSVLLQIPMELICDIYHIEPLKKGDIFTCNFYKISEDPKIEHYASYAPIVSSVPNFHMPDCFAKAIVIEE